MFSQAQRKTFNQVLFVCDCPGFSRENHCKSIINTLPRLQKIPLESTQNQRPYLNTTPPQYSSAPEPCDVPQVLLHSPSQTLWHPGFYQSMAGSERAVSWWDAQAQYWSGSPSPSQDCKRSPAEFHLWHNCCSYLQKITKDKSGPWNPLKTICIPISKVK